MKIHEYQAKKILRANGVAVPGGVACLSVAEADDAVGKITGGVWVVKAQIHAGGRGKGGGVKIAKNADEARRFARDIFGMQLITPQTGAEGRQVKRLLIEEGADIRTELYLAMLIDRARQLPVLMASAEGGTDIEEVAAEQPDKIHKIWLQPDTPPSAAESETIAAKIGIPKSAYADAAELMANVARAFYETDASLVEVNPLVITGGGKLLALDAKMNFDDNALFRRPDILALRDADEEDPAEAEAAKYDLSYISLDGNIGCMVNGAGLAMATMDIIKLCGGEPANFLDVGGGASKEKVTAAFKLMLANPGLAAVLINIFGGIMRCDVIAEGVVGAAREMNITVPLVVRLEGTNVKEGKRILADSGLAIIAATTMQDAAEKAVRAAGG
ncbi:MAG: ADP-forming succinate--CoA ligase subunit beta [Gammaproteobacteria bacterium]